MAADLTTAGFTTVDLSDPSYSMANIGVVTTALNPAAIKLGAKINMGDFGGGGGGGGPTRPSTGFLYPRGDG
jgi:hypothetical protein